MTDGALDIILLALVAGFVLLRLRGVLGRRTGHERPPNQPVEDNVLPLPDRRKGADPNLAPPRDTAAGSPVAAGLARIKLADTGFDEPEFISGARAAYEMVVTAFAAGDLDTLRAVLAPEVLSGFRQAIEDRQKAGHKLETTVRSIRAADIIEADLRGTMAEVTVKFVSDLVNVTRNAAGQIVSGSPTAAEEVTDIWTFSRNTRSSDPNWTLIGTATPA